jgi:TPR repeat protein
VPGDPRIDDRKSSFLSIARDIALHYDIAQLYTQGCSASQRNEMARLWFTNAQDTRTTSVSSSVDMTILGPLYFEGE